MRSSLLIGHKITGQSDNANEYVSERAVSVLSRSQSNISIQFPPLPPTQRCYPLVAGAQSASPWMSP